MNQQDEGQQQATAQPNGPHELFARLYREIGISAVAAALESNKRPKAKTIEAGQNPAVLRDEQAA